MIEATWAPPALDPELAAKLMTRLMAAASGDCWEWGGQRLPTGYGRLRYHGREGYSHRAAHEAWIGPIPAGFDVHHECHNKSCSNPRHLQAMTHRSNLIADDTIIGRQVRRTHCPAGHPLSGENLVLYRTMRKCRACSVEHGRRRSREKQARRVGEALRIREALRPVLAAAAAAQGMGVTTWVRQVVAKALAAEGG